MVKRSDVLRVHPTMKVLVKELKEDLNQVLGKKVSDVDVTKFLVETYPKDMVARNLLRKKLRKKVRRKFLEHEVESFLSFT